jgi:hypothetical protein
MRLKNYNPLEGLFSTEVNGEFITGKVNDLIALTKNRPSFNINISDIPNIPHHSNPEENIYTINADLQYPIIVLVDKNKIKSVLDGHHRIQKALYLGKTKIKTKFVDEDDIKKYFIKSTLKETIKKVLKEELPRNKYQIWFFRRLSIIEDSVTEEIQSLNCERCHLGYKLFRDIVLRQVVVSLRNYDHQIEFDRDILFDFILDRYEPGLRNAYTSVCENCD